MLAVKFSNASDFVTEYAENLSAGGLFVRQAHELEPLSEVEVEIDLPGFRAFTVKAKVAHVMGPEFAAKCNRSPGAGLQLMDLPKDFEKALSSYLERLGRRRDCLVFAWQERCQEDLEAAGFRTAAVDLANAIAAADDASNKAVALIVEPVVVSHFEEGVAKASRLISVIGYDGVAAPEILLNELDALLI